MEIVAGNLFQTEPAAVQEAVTVEKPANPILPVANELFWGAVCFALLWALMKWVLLPPITRGMQQRSAKVRADLEAADSTSAKADAELRDYEASLQSSKAEAVRIIEDARNHADDRRKEVIAVAEADAAGLRAEAAREIADAQDRAKADLQQSVAAIAIEAAEAVVQKPLDHDAATRAIEDYVNRAGSQN